MLKTKPGPKQSPSVRGGNVSVEYMPAPQKIEEDCQGCSPAACSEREGRPDNFATGSSFQAVQGSVSGSLGAGERLFDCQMRKAQTCNAGGPTASRSSGEAIQRGGGLEHGPVSGCFCYPFQPRVEVSEHDKAAKMQAVTPRLAEAMPPRSRLPIPWEVVCLLVMEALDNGQMGLALHMLLMFCLYLRPNEALKIRPQDVVAPVLRGGKGYRFWTVVIHPLELGVASKTLEFD